MIYDDADTYGGHQVMGVRATESLLAHGVYVCFAYYKGNNRLESKLKSMQMRYPHIELIPTKVKSKRLQAIRLFLDIVDLLAIIGITRKAKPSFVLAIQGDIEIGSIGLLASCLAGVKVISYVPFAHSAMKKGLKFARIRDLIYRILYKLPSAFITITESAAHEISNLSKRSVCVVPVCIKDSCDNLLKKNKDTLRSDLNLPKDKYIAAVVGRIVFKHKGHDFIVKVAEQYSSELTDVVFLIVGDGPDEDRLKSLVQDAGLNNMFIFLTWCEDISDVLDAIDLLLIPSVFEGVPLTMLEAMQRRCPILASSRDGMREILPIDMLYQPDSKEDFLYKLKKFTRHELSNLASLLDGNAMHQKKGFSVEKFHESYYLALTKLQSEFY